MKYAINLNSVLPVRASASERSEMVTQLLFGDFCEILEEQDSFVKIVNSQDKYEGYVDTKMLKDLNSEEFSKLKVQQNFRVCVPIADVFCLTTKSIYRLSAGSLLPNYNSETSKFCFDDVEFQIHPSFVTLLPHADKSNAVSIAMTFLNTPYLWGGKNILGIDCSGFIQVVFSLCGYSLPRDAKDQGLIGSFVAFNEMQNGDLCFFSKNESIVHVGLYIGDGRILHASGLVQINQIDEKGIFNGQGVYTHKLAFVRRLD